MMNDINLTVNQIILDKTDNESFRILYMSHDRSEVYGISLTDRRQVPVPMSVADVGKASLGMVVSGQFNYTIEADSMLFYYLHY